MRILRACVNHQLFIHSHKMDLKKFEIRVFLKHYWKQDYKAAAAAAWRMCQVEGEGVVSEHVAQRWFQRSNTAEENTKIYHVLEDANYGILRIYAEFWKKIHKKLLVGCQKNLVHQKVPYIARLRHLENHTEAVDLSLVNWHLNGLNVEWIYVISISVIPWMNDLSGDCHTLWKMGLLQQPLLPRNNGSVSSACQKLVWTHINGCLGILKVWFSGSLFQMGVQSMRIFILNNWNEFMKFWDGDIQH